MQGKLMSAMDDERDALSWSREIDHVGSRVHALGLTLLHRVYRRDFQEVFDRAGELIAFTAEEGLSRQQEVATSEDFSVYLCLQAEVLAAAGRADQAVERLIRERPNFDRSGLRIWLPEVLRMTGEMILLAAPGSVERTHGAFAEAAEMETHR